MRARLYAAAGKLAGRSFEVGEGIVLGRSPDNGVVVDHPLISSKHARIAPDPDGDGYLLEDLGSRNGTFLAGLRVHEPERLGALDVVGLAGAIELIFQVCRGTAGPTTADDRLDRSAAGTTPVPPLSGAIRMPPPPASPPAASPATSSDTSPGTSPGLADFALPPEVAAAARREGERRTQHGADEEGWALPPAATPPAATPPADDAPRTHHDADEPGWVLPSPPSAGGGKGRPPRRRESPSSPWERLPLPRSGAIPTASPPAVAVAPWSLEILYADGRRKRVALWPGERVVGRAVDCDVSIDDATLSRRHARLQVRPHGVRLADLGSTNRSFVEDQAVEREVELQDGVRLRFGVVEARLVRTADGEGSG